MKQQYQKPTLKTVEFKPERGFATSNAFSRTESDARLFEMLFEQDPRNEQFGVDNWSSPSPDGSHFSVEDWENL